MGWYAFTRSKNNEDQCVTDFCQYLFIKYEGGCPLELKLVCYAERLLYRLYRYRLSKAWFWKIKKSHVSNKTWNQWISCCLDSALKTRAASTGRIKEKEGRRDKVFRTLGTGDCWYKVVCRYYIGNADLANLGLSLLNCTLWPSVIQIHYISCSNFGVSNRQVTPRNNGYFI